MRKKYPNTKIYPQDEYGYTAVTLHKTIIVRFSASEILLNSGGWQTATTKRRMNQISDQFNLNFHVYQEDHVWFVDIGDNMNPVEFEDTMSFDRQEPFEIRFR